MNSIKKIQTPLTEDVIKSLEAGDEIFLSGIIYTARDQAHLRLSKMIKEGKRLPISLKGEVIYYCGPTPSGSRIIGSCGPTTSSRMDPFTHDILDAGVKGMIGKGRRSRSVTSAIKEKEAVYFLAPAGAGAYLSGRVKSAKPVAFEDLGPEAIYKLEVEDFPLIVGIDSSGEDIYDAMR